MAPASSNREKEGGKIVAGEMACRHGPTLLLGVGRTKDCPTGPVATDWGNGTSPGNTRLLSANGVKFYLKQVVPPGA